MAEDENTYKDYIALSPRDDLDVSGNEATKENYKHYQSKLKWALDNGENENIKNIAITGYYGAGKSSILKTFIKNHHSKNPTKEKEKKYKFLELSLATFHEDKKGHEKVKDIEKSLLQQIFYKVEDSDVPASNYNKIEDAKFLDRADKTIIALFFVLLLTRVFNLILGQEVSLLRLLIDDINSWSDLYFKFSSNVFIDIILFILLTIFTIRNYESIKVPAFKKISFNNLEAELVKNDEELSVLSRFLDEIIYFFKETKYNVVVIEDIDRFESTEIFSNLRELNLILNNSDLIKHHIVFIYAIKNEQFKTASDRTKFFDFIIPVIPVVNFETSANEFKKKLKDSDIDTKWLNDNMINSLFYLEDDIRVINNTFNELITYYNILNKKSDFNNDVESKTSLLNLLIPILFYKNVDPHDFSCLLKRKGYLYAVINSEEQIKEKQISILKNEIIDLNKTIEEANNKAINDTLEIKHFVFSLLKNMASSKLRIGTNDLKFNTNTQSNDVDNVFDTLIQNKKINVMNQTYNNQKTTIDINQVQEKLNFKIEERLKHISYKNSINQFEEKIKSIESSIEKIKNQNLAQTIKREDIAEILNLEVDKMQFKEQGKYFAKNETNFDLIETLILNDYINKDYFLYLSDYTKLGMSINDYKILISIKNKKNLGFDKKIDDPSSILKRISPSDYNSNAVLNFDLVDYILKTLVTNYPEEINYVVDWISKFSEQGKEFIIAYCRREYKENVFIKYLSAKSKNLWIRIMNDNEFKNHKDYLYKLIIDNAPKERLVDYCKNSDFGAYIEMDTIKIYHIDNYKLKFLIDNLKEPIKLKEINVDGSIPNLHYIFNSNAYEINLHNIDSFIHVYGIKVVNYKSKLITVINQQETLVEMRDYIYSKKELEPFIKNIILENPANTKEEERIILEILNMPEEKVSFETKKSLFKQQELIIRNIIEVEDSSLRLFILKTQRMGNHLDNVLSFYKTITNLETAEERNEAIEDVVKYIIEFDNVLKVNDETQRINLQKLIDLCLPANSLDNNIYKQFISLLSKRLLRKDFNFTPARNLNQDKFKILIEKSYLDLTNDNINFIIEEGHQDLLPLYFEKHENKLIEFFNTHLSSIKHEMGEAILEAEIEDAIKTQLVNLFFQNREKFFEFTAYRKLLYNHLLETNGVNFNNSILQEIGKRKFKAELIPEIFNVIYPALDKSRIKTFFENQNNLNYKKLSKHRKRPSFENKPANKIMLDILLDKDIITGYDEISKDNKFKVRFVNDY